MSRLRDNKLVKQLVHKVQCSVSPIYQTIRLNDHRIKFEIDSGASDTFCCEATWQTLGKPILQPVSVQYQVAEGSPLPVVGQFQSTASIELTNLTDHFRENLSCAESTASIEHVTTTGPENSLDTALGCLKDFSLDIRFKAKTCSVLNPTRFKRSIRSRN